MKVMSSVPEERVVECPKGGFISERFLLESDGMGYTMTQTTIPVNGKQFWHYKNHLESCYCVSGKGVITDANSGREYEVIPGTIYVLDQHDPHYFEALEETVLICVFNPPLKGRETHRRDGSYE